MSVAFERICISCKKFDNKYRLIRIVNDKTRGIIIDTEGKIEGRGAYICKNPECVRNAIKTKGLERSFKMAIPKSVYEELEKECAFGEK